MKVLMLFLFLFIKIVFGGKILAPDEDNYLLVTVRNDTTYKEFVDFFNFYLKIRVACYTCIPPITNVITTAFFGEINSLIFNQTNATAVIQQFMNSPAFETTYFPASKTNFTDKICKFFCKDIEWLLSLVGTRILRTLTNPSARIRKKHITLITNYYYEPGYDSLLGNIFYDKYNFTFISLFVPSTDFLNLTALNHSKVPVTIFDISENNINLTKAREIYLNRYIDFDYENYTAPVVAFVEMSNNSLDYAYTILSSVIDKQLCQLSNDFEYYLVSLLIYSDNTQFKFNTVDIVVPHLQNYTLSYFNNILDDYIDTPLFTIKSNSCNENFYSEIFKRLNIAETNNDTFTFYITDNYPKCMVKILDENGMIVNSFMNHFDLFIVSNVENNINEDIVFETITSKIISPFNASMKANHVTVINHSDYNNLGELYGVCQDSSLYGKLSSANIYVPPHSFDWLVIGGILTVFLIISGLILWILTFSQGKNNYTDFLKNFRRKSRKNSSISNLSENPSNPNKLEQHQDKWEIPTNLLEVKYSKPLGKGSSATIYGAFLNCKAPLAKLYPSLNTRHFSKCSVAVKVSLIYNNYEDEQFKNEIKAMTILGWHPNICSFLGWSMSRDRPCLVFESIPNDLLRYVKEFRDIGFPLTKHILLISWQIANGMAHIAQHKLVHRDLACRNVLLTEDLRVKIADFGLCCDCDTNYVYTGSLTKQLPLKWLSLEALLDRLFSEKSDVWSFGVLLYEIFTCGIVPYVTLTNEELVEFLRDGKRLDAPDESPEDLVKIMKECWHELPECRPTFLKIRETITSILNENSKTYGYLTPNDLMLVKAENE